MENLSRRDLAGLSLGLGAAALTGGRAYAQNEKPLLRRPIPHGKGETIPIVGVGTSEVFEVGSSTADRAGPTAVVQAAYRLVLGRDAGAEELADALSFLSRQELTFQNSSLQAKEKQEALVDFCQALLCLNEFAYVE